jgi:hypothetical protein
MKRRRPNRKFSSNNGWCDHGVLIELINIVEEPIYIHQFIIVWSLLRSDHWVMLGGSVNLIHSREMKELKKHFCAFRIVVCPGKMITPANKTGFSDCINSDGTKTAFALIKRNNITHLYVLTFLRNPIVVEHRGARGLILRHK